MRNLRGWQALANDAEHFQLPTLISRYHAVTASHSWANSMPWVRWIGTNGVAYTNRALDTMRIGKPFPPSVPYGDFLVIILDSPVNGAVPAIAVGHAATATKGLNYWGMLGSATASIWDSTNGTATLTPATGDWKSWWTYGADFGFYGGVGGDSGLCRFIPLEDHIVLLGPVSLSSGTGAMPAADEVQAAMNELSDRHGLPRQTLQVETFSRYAP